MKNVETKPYWEFAKLVRHLMAHDETFTDDLLQSLYDLYKAGDNEDKTLDASTSLQIIFSEMAQYQDADREQDS